MYPLLRLRTFKTNVECSSEKPRNCPNRKLWFHFGRFLSSCNLDSSTSTGHPHTWERHKSLWLDPVSVSISIWEIPDSWLGTLLYTQTECLTAKDQSVRSSTPFSVQCNDECIINVRAIYIIVCMERSALEFWCWAPTPEKLWIWPLPSQSLR